MWTFSRFHKATLLALAAFFMVFSAAPAQAKKPRNPRWGKARPDYSRRASTQASAISLSTAPAGPHIPRLPAGRWLPEVQSALESFIAAHGQDSPGYTPDQPPAAVLAFNDVVVINDVGLAVFQRMVDRADFKFGDAFWGEVPLAYGRQRLRAAYGIFLEQPQSVWMRQPSYQQYRKGFFRAYRDMCSLLGPLECRSWLARLPIGYGEAEITAYTRAALGAEYLRPIGTELVADAADDPAPVSVRHGLAWVPEIRALIDLLRASGFEVWTADANQQHEFEVVAAQADFPPERVLGIRTKVAAEKLTSTALPPVPVRGGKANAVSSHLGQAPLLVVGAQRDDQELLQFAAPNALRLLLDRGDADLLRLAQDRGWLVQPAFPALPPAPPKTKP
ncbi:MAG: hypothetical protein HY922_02930 [Elusimicrobia bacterium]|nr:hypothetical protein [Elusimicrobiota bacterium]